MNTLTLSRPAGEIPATSAQYDLAVYILRAQPFHFGHKSVIDLAFKHARNVLLLIGSANAGRSHRNPFTYEERTAMIFKSMGAPPLNLYCEPIEDNASDTQWVRDAQTAVNFCLDDIAETEGISVANRKKMRVSLIGHSKDHTSFYLNMFPGYESLEAPNYQGLSSTPIRMAYFSNIVDMWLKNCDGHRPGDKPIEHVVPTAVRDFMIEFSQTQAYKEIKEEYDFVTQYKAKWTTAPFPVTMITTDAMVVQSGHILLVRRRGHPGRGKWALPGGYLGQNETIVNGMIRELVEETKIAIPPDELKKCIVAQRVFDDPNRDPRGRLPPRRTMPKITRKKVKLSFEPVEGSDDADLAQWFPIAEIKRSELYADHYMIIEALLGS
jgi:bifunctional NMN adenylyltransferase/nudix hydrolase